MTATLSKPPKKHLKATLILACLAQFMVILDVSVVNVALPAIRGGLPPALGRRIGWERRAEGSALKAPSPS